MALHKSVARSVFVQKAIGVAAAEYLRLVWKTSRFVIEPADLYGRFEREAPIILTVWHGQHFLLPFLRRPPLQAKALISRHRDGAINAIAVERLGGGIIRGSGDHEGRFDRKGGVGAFKSMVSALREGCNVVLTADVPKVARVAGRGIVMLARISGRPIYPACLATSRRVELNNWDRSAINLPFSRGAIVAGDPIHVPSAADDSEIELYRQKVETALNTVTERAYAIVDRAEKTDRR